MLLYHLSEKNHDNETFIPRPLPEWRAMEGENWRIKRICVSTSIDGALTALLSSDSEAFGKHLFVHVPENIERLESKKKNIFTPTTKLIPDVEVTGERWLKCPVKMKCIGEIEVMTVDPDVKLTYDLDGLEFMLDKFIWKWVWKKDKKEV